MTFLANSLYSLFWELLIIILIVLVYKKTEILTKAPFLDIVLALLTWLPWLVFSLNDSWPGFLACFLGQFIAVQIFCVVHRKMNPSSGPHLLGTIDSIVGIFRNQLGLWITLPGIPVLLIIRASQILVYPFLVWILKFPKYNQAEWVNVSRQKFSGLVAADLVWCLYCDWMTGVYSLGGEMLRNVESFWCPIKFYENKKCENCKTHFPDIEKWVKADGTMEDVQKALKENYLEGDDKPRSWWGHPERKK
jgi:hypothetical protein